MIRKTFYRCSCFLQSNIYLEQVDTHVNYVDDEHFRNEYQHLASAAHPLEQLLSSVHAEVRRRQNLETDARQRREKIQREYQPLHPQLAQRCLQTHYLSEPFRDLCSKPSHAHKQLKKFGNGIFSLPVFTPEFCSRMIAELKHFEASPMPKGRPNTMNHYGILLDELGWTDFIDRLRVDYLNPLAKALYGEEYVGSTGLDSHKAFVVSYKIGQDVELGCHYDNAEITLNVSLGDEFEAGDLYFGAMAKANRTSFCNLTFVEHTPTYGVLHRGQHLHGSEPIESGERYNLIIWMRSSSRRNQLCPMCWEKPRRLLPVHSDSFGDGMTCEHMLDEKKEEEGGK